MPVLRRFRNLFTLALLGASLAVQASSLTRADYAAHKAQIQADYKSDKLSCDRLSGNDKDICVKQAKGRQKVAMAELDFNDSGRDADAHKLVVAKADSDYAVARERCDDKKASDKQACLGQAKAAHVKALAGAGS